MAVVDCGSCSACCTLLAVPALDKPSCVRCEYVNHPHGGCRIYDAPEKPPECDDFRCLWLVSQGRKREDRMPYGLRPDRCGVMFHDAAAYASVEADVDPNVLYVHVDPRHPGAWRWEPVLAHVNMVLSRGCTVHIIIGTRRIVLGPDGSVTSRDDGSSLRMVLREEAA